jgi:hypothetical protein
LISLFVIAIIFSLYYYFNRIFKLEGEARPFEMNLPNETQNIKFNIEEVTMDKLKWKNGLLIKGWVFRENVKLAKRNVFLVLKSKNRPLVFNIDKANILRPDVSACFHLVGGINNHGFEIFVPLSLLKESDYQVGFVILDETGKYFTMSLKEIRISDGAVKMINTISEIGSKPKSNQVNISLKVPTCKINYYIDNISIFGNNLNINGWSFLQGMNSEFMKSYLLLKKNEKVSVFSVDIQLRTDVTNFYKSSGVKLDSSGVVSYALK